MHGTRTKPSGGIPTRDEPPPTRPGRAAQGAPRRRRRSDNATDRISQRQLQRARVASEAPVRHCGTLVMLDGPDPGAVHAVGEQPLVLGRGLEAGWRLSDPDVSRRHARVFREAEAFVIEDLGSANGTYVHGKRVMGQTRLEAGDRIQLGATALLRFDTHDANERDVLERLYRSAVRDPLTSAHNRRYLDERLRGETSYASRHGEDLAFLILDVDHFKGINDAHGHPAGDAVLRSIVSVLQHTLRPEDLLARYGGDELCVLARGLGTRAARAMAERLREAVARMRVRTESVELSVTVSVGVALLGHGTPAVAAQRLVGDADEALYRAKHEGRNRACLAPPSR